MQPELVSLLEVQSGHFQFESGHHGNLWLDLHALLLRPHRLQPYLNELAARLARYKIQGVCGPLIGGAFVAQAIATILDLEFSFAERVETMGCGVHYRIPDRFRAALGGKRVAIVDDAINAGSAVCGTLTGLQLCGANPVVIGALFVLGSAAVRLSAEHDIPVESMAQLPGSLWTPSKCPLCAAHVPLKNAANEA